MIDDPFLLRLVKNTKYKQNIIDPEKDVTVI